MTDEKKQKSISTQTNLPKTSLAFSLINTKSCPIPTSYETFIKRMQQNESILKHQMNALSEIDRQIEMLNGNVANSTTQSGNPMDSSFEPAKV